MDQSKPYRALLVSKSNSNLVTYGIVTRQTHELPVDNVRVQVLYSALNYKDGLALAGNPGVAKSLPLVPGIDAVGQVVESRSATIEVGQHVLIQNAEFGTAVDGGYQEFVDVPTEWAIPIPNGLNSLEMVTLGTAGFTAAQCCLALQASVLNIDDGELVVSGATGGVGVFAVQLLARLGYQVVAATGKMDRANWLTELGATRVINRTELNDASKRPLLSAKWAGAVDTVGGNTLATIIRSMQPHRTTTACGLVGGSDLELTVFPFILRGVTLVGIDSALVSRNDRIAIWQKLATDWRLENIAALAEIVPLSDIASAHKQILNGQICGRVIIDVGA